MGALAVMRRPRAVPLAMPLLADTARVRAQAVCVWQAQRAGKIEIHALACVF